MMDPYVGEIRIFAGNFAPRGWAFCNGQLMPISQNTALFSILGTIYGGDGKTNFALPDLMGRAPMHQGTIPGGSTYPIGEQTGAASVTLTTAEMPSHAHAAMANSQSGNTSNPEGAVWAKNPGSRGVSPTPIYSASPTVPMNPLSLAPAGGGAPHDNMQPYLGVGFIIALAGVYPPRS